MDTSWRREENENVIINVANPFFHSSISGWCSISPLVLERRFVVYWLFLVDWSIFQHCRTLPLLTVAGRKWTISICSPRWPSISGSTPRIWTELEHRNKSSFGEQTKERESEGSRSLLQMPSRRSAVEKTSVSTKMMTKIPNNGMSLSCNVFPTRPLTFNMPWLVRIRYECR